MAGRPEEVVRHPSPPASPAVGPRTGAVRAGRPLSAAPVGTGPAPRARQPITPPNGAGSRGHPFQTPLPTHHPRTTRSSLGRPSRPPPAERTAHRPPPHGTTPDGRQDTDEHLSTSRPGWGARLWRAGHRDECRTGRGWRRRRVGAADRPVRRARRLLHGRAGDPRPERHPRRLRAVRPELPGPRRRAVEDRGVRLPRRQLHRSHHRRPVRPPRRPTTAPTPRSSTRCPARPGWSRSASAATTSASPR